MIVEAKGLWKKFGDFEAVRGIDLHIRPGECFGILGPNGAGKTTTIRTIQCVSVPTAGELKVFDLEARTHPREIKSRIGVCQQEDCLDPDFTVLQNLLVFARYFGIPKKEARRRALALLTFWGLEEKVSSTIRELSGGLKRRLMIARSLINQPNLLILDEPTTGLDPQSRHQVWERIRELRKEGKTILLTTHYMDEAEILCDRLIIMDHGKILVEGGPAELIRAHLPGGGTLEDLFLKLTGRALRE